MSDDAEDGVYSLEAVADMSFDSKAAGKLSLLMEAMNKPDLKINVHGEDFFVQEFNARYTSNLPVAQKSTDGGRYWGWSWGWGLGGGGGSVEEEGCGGLKVEGRVKDEDQ